MIPSQSRSLRQSYLTVGRKSTKWQIEVPHFSYRTCVSGDTNKSHNVWGQRSITWNTSHNNMHAYVHVESKKKHSKKTHIIHIYTTWFFTFENSIIWKFENQKRIHLMHPNATRGRYSQESCRWAPSGGRAGKPQQGRAARDRADGTWVAPGGDGDRHWVNRLKKVCLGVQNGGVTLW